jgi:shikimate dehydrogenase
MIHLGLTGWPLSHSLSPKIHNAALQAVELEGRYSLYPLALDDVRGLVALLNNIRSGALQGLNVTIPYKQTVIPLLDELTPIAAAIGAVNTIYLRDNKLIGDNTDAPGFLSDLKRFIRNWESEIGSGRSALILGAGGSARAATYALLSDEWKVTLAARRSEQAKALIAQLSNPKSSLARIDYHPAAFRSLFSTLDLIVNATPVGMFPETEASPWPEGLPFPAKAVVYDLVYNPRETRFVRDARAAGLSATTGVRMLVEQAALSFEIWAGCVAPRPIMFSALEE